MLKNLLGGSKGRELDEMQSVLQKMQETVNRHQSYTERGEHYALRLSQIDEPIQRVSSGIDALTSRLGELERRFEGMVQLSRMLENLEDRASDLARNQERAEAQFTGALRDIERFRALFEDLSGKVDLAVDLKDRLTAFLEMEQPFQELRGQAESLRSEVEGMGEQLVRVREQHERHLDAQQLAASKMEALDRRRGELGRDLADKERRVTAVAQAVHGLDGVQEAVDKIRRDTDTLKALGDFVGQKLAALEAQREAVEGALARADQLDRAMRQIDAGVRQQQDNAATLGAMQDQVTALRTLHEAVVERSAEMIQLQRATEERAQAIRDDLDLARAEMKNAVDRFEFETRGLESVSQRVTDVRTALSDFENRFKTLGESSHAVEELKSRVQGMAAQVRLLSEDLARAGQDTTQLQAMRRELEQVERTTHELTAQVTRLEEARPAMEAALRDADQLGRAHAMVKDTLEQTQLARAEIERSRESHTETRSWLGAVESSLGEIKEQVGELRKLTPTIEIVRKQARDVTESMSAIESRREFFEDLRRRMSDLGSLGSTLDERGRQLQGRMEAAEQSFVALNARAEEAERTSKAMAAMTAHLQDAQQRADEIGRMIASIEARCESVEGIAEQSRALRDELEQRQRALKDAASDLQRASRLREEAAASAQQLEEMTRRLSTAQTSADQRMALAGTLSAELEDRVANLQYVEKRLGQFEERLARWDLVDQDVTRSLEQLSARQSTVEALQADLDRMFSIA